MARRFRGPAGGLLALTMLLVACAPTPGGGPSASGAALTRLRVGVLPIVDVAPIYLAIERGMFAAEGLSVETELVQGGAAAIPALAAGELDVTYGAWPSFLQANQEGIALRAVADGVAGVPGYTQFLAMPGSGLAGDAAAMTGRVVAINTLQNLGELALRSVLREAGADPYDVQPVEVPFPDMPAALERGEVDVIWAVEPVVTLARETLGADLVVDTYTGELRDFPVAGYQVTADFAAANPAAVAAFGRAVAAASRLANEDRDAVNALLPTIAGITPELAQTITLPHYSEGMSPASLQRVYRILVEFEIVEPGLDVPSLVLESE